jgi:hypothetical protein
VLKVDRTLASVHGDPRYDALLRKLGLSHCAAACEFARAANLSARRLRVTLLLFCEQSIADDNTSARLRCCPHPQRTGASYRVSTPCAVPIKSKSAGRTANSPTVTTPAI